MDPIVHGSVLGVTSGILLSFIYEAVRDERPQLYAYNKTPLERTVQRTFWRYLAFHTIPPLLAFYATGVTADRLHLNAQVAAILSAISFLAATTLKAIIRELGRSPHLSITLLSQIASAVWTILVAFVAYRTRNHTSAFIPAPSSFVEAAWSAIFVAAIIKAYETTMRSRAATNTNLIIMARSNMGTEVWEHARKSAEDKNIPAFLVHAIMVIESLQRPKWTRKLENIAATITPRYYRLTQGVTQELSGEPMGDMAAIDLTVEHLKSLLDEKDIPALREEPFDVDPNSPLYADPNPARRKLTARDVCEKVATSRNRDIGYKQRFVALCQELRDRPPV